ncbi:lipopolysaccharide biosynthesis protein [Rubrivivax albus]|uniref:Lipopolysaccharide biosynthesis protein n=1 Tax=Rubrivivax albus TaxID=2499835 RepID=A0A3S2TNU3_9BURK|nr:lipopolysaccharide biosynthesis protein [Rubrivivax albus]RVT53466.1 lipopolysaccharide biosynthesis protein [Rubrivivax albus]
MTSVRKALALSFLERYLSILLALASNMILARLLTPHEIGQYSVTLAVLGVAHVLRDFGIGSYLIQAPEVDDSQIGTAFGVSLLLGGGLFAAVFALAPWAAGFYGESGMTLTMRIAALSFLVLPFCTVRMSLLRREMRFKALLYVSLTATAISLVVTVLLAWQGMGSDSMAVGAVLQNLCTAVGTWLASDDRRVFRPTLVHWRPVLAFGGQSAATNVVTTLSMDANDLVVGKVLGFQPVALVSRAQGVVNLFHRDVMNAVRNVALPAFAEAHRGGDELVSRFRHSVAIVTGFAWPFYGFLSIFSLEFLRVMFGPQWDAAAPLVPVFALAGAIGALTSLVSTALVAVGRIELVTRTEFVVQPMRLAIVIGAVTIWGTIESVAWAFLLAALPAAPMFLAAGERGVPGLRRRLLRTTGPSLAVTAAALMPSIAYVGFMGWSRSEPLPLIGTTLVICGGIILGILVGEKTDHPVTREPLYQELRRRFVFHRSIAPR